MENNKYASQRTEADILVLTVGPERFDFAVKRDPNDKSGKQASQVGKLVSAITDVRYLYNMASFQDWCADQSSDKAEALPSGSDEKRAEHKNAGYSRNRAAVCRYYARKASFGADRVTF